MSDEIKQTTEEQVVAEETTADVAPVEAEEKSSEADEKLAQRRKTKQEKPQVSSGKAFIKATYNNTIVALTDNNGNVIAWSSAGKCGFKGPKKATPFAATIISKDAVEKAKKRGLKEVDVFVRGVGQGRESAVRSLHASGLEVLSIKDITPVPHNGCRQKKPRRV